MAPKSVFITAVKTGIGLEMVRQFATSADPPKHIFAAGRNLKAASDLVELANAHKNIHFVELDVTDDKQIENAVKVVSDVVGDEGLNLLINNAAVIISEGDQLPNIKRDVINRHLDVNATSALLIVQAFIPLLKKAAEKQPGAPMSVNKAAIVNITSGSGSLHTKVEFSASDFGFYGYCASKAAMNILTKNLSFDLKPHGILIVGICPGYVYTKLVQELLDFRRQQGQEVPECLHEKHTVTPDVSVSLLMGTMSRLTDKHTGGYFRRNGEKMEDFDFASATED